MFENLIDLDFFLPFCNLEVYLHNFEGLNIEWKRNNNRENTVLDYHKTVFMWKLKNYENTVLDFKKWSKHAINITFEEFRS